MDTSDKSTDNMRHMVEQKKLEQQQRLEANRAAESRRSSDQRMKSAEYKQESKRQPEGRIEEKAASGKANAGDIANSRKSCQLETRSNDPSRFEELARNRNPTESQRKELQRDLKSNLDRSDPHWREADRRTEEGEREFKTNAKARREFCHIAGTEEHKRWEAEVSEAERKAGRVKGMDYRTEAVVHHPDGGPTRLDHVDYRSDIITDRKPLAKGETEQQLKKRYEKQRTRHVEAYEHSTGREVLEYRYSLYPSPKDT